MSDTNKQYTIRLTLEDGQVLTGALNQMGSEGEKTFTKLQTGAIGADAALSKLGSSIKTSLIGFVAAPALAASFTGALDSMKELQETSEKIQMPTDKIQELNYAAVQVTGSAQPMNEALLTFTSNLGQAQMGLGRFLPILKDLGINFKGQSNIQVLGEYINAIQNAKSASEALNLSEKGFGDGPGQQLVGLWQQGTAGLNAYAQAAHEAGDIVDQDLVKKAADGAKEMDQAWYDTKMHFDAYIAEMVSAYDGMKKTMAQGADGHGNLPLPGGYVPGEENRNDAADSAQKAAASNAEYDRLDALDNAPTTPTPMTDQERKKSEAIQKQIDQLTLTNKLMNESDEYQQVYNALAKNGVDINSQAGQKIKELVDQHIELQKRQQLSNSLATDFSTAMEDAAFHTKSLNDILSSLGTSMEKQLFSAATSDLTHAGSGFINDMLKGFGFADGGVMTKSGPVPLKKYSGGGIASSPQLAMFGEGDDPEAYVPVPSGKIPVQLSGSGGNGTTQVDVTVVNQTSTPVQATGQSSSNGSVMVYLTTAVNNMVTSGKLNKSMAATFGIKPVLG